MDDDDQKKIRAKTEKKTQNGEREYAFVLTELMIKFTALD